MSSDYKGDSIKVLEGLEGVRKRPAMYIGSTGKEGLHHLVYEVVDNSVDEALVGHCTKIVVTLTKEGSAIIEDDGRGIPVDPHPQYKVPAAQIALTKLHAGGKFDKDSYSVSGGLHGVGVSCVNALSKKLILTIKRNGNIYKQEYSIGIPKTELKVVGKCPEKETGTIIEFWPDPDIFSVLDFDYKVLETRFREITFLNPGLKIMLEDEIKAKKEEIVEVKETKKSRYKPVAYLGEDLKDKLLIQWPLTIISPPMILQTSRILIRIVPLVAVSLGLKCAGRPYHFMNFSILKEHVICSGPKIMVLPEKQLNIANPLLNYLATAR